MIGFYFIQDKYMYKFSSINKKDKELNINQEKMNEENESLLTKKNSDNNTNDKIKIIYNKILNYIFLSCVILYKL